MVYIYPSAAHLKDEPVIEIQKIHFLPSVLPSEHPHDPVAIEQIDHEEDGEVTRLMVCSECCQPRITISCGGKLEISGSGTICKNFGVRLRSCDYQNALKIWQTKVDLVASIIRSLILDRFEHDYLNKVIHMEDIVMSPVGPVERRSNLVKIVFRMKPRASKVFSGRLPFFMDVLHPELFTYRHSKGCLYSSEPDLKIQDPDGSHKMAKALHLKLCNGAYVNIETFTFGMTKSLSGNQSLGAYDTPVRDTQELLHLRRLIDLLIADENGMINRGFLTTASAETLAVRENVIRLNGKDYWLNVISPPIFYRSP